MISNIKTPISQLKFKLNSNYFIPAIGLGTYQIKKEEDIYTAISEAYKAGYRHIDSAVCYKNEHLIGNTLKKLNIPRDEIFITTKIPVDGLTYSDSVRYINQSLKNFQTEYLDLLLIHWPGAKTVEDRLGVWKAMEEAVQEGKVRSIGVSNFMPVHLKSILDNCTIKPAVNQFELHPLYMPIETIEMCNQEGILIEAYSTFARMDPKLIENSVLVKIADKYSKKPTQVLVRWAIQHGWVILPKSTHIERIKENIDVDDFELSEIDISELDGLNCMYKVAWDPQTINY
jgi:diketogulonate reductase-like aldo/keto reductase